MLRPRFAEDTRDDPNIEWRSRLPMKKRLIVLWHDESTFQAIDVKKLSWVQNGDHGLRKRGRGVALISPNSYRARRGGFKLPAKASSTAKPTTDTGRVKM